VTVLKLLFIFVSLFLSLSSALSNGVHVDESQIEQRALHIVKDCVHKAKEIREERICESKVKVIEFCLREELKSKDLEKAHASCMHQYIL
jgi:hypothetical protein